MKAVFSLILTPPVLQYLVAWLCRSSSLSMSWLLLRVEVLVGARLRYDRLVFQNNCFPPASLALHPPAVRQTA